MTDRLRTWTATITVRDDRTMDTVSFDATDSPSDLLKDQTECAVREAATLLDIAEYGQVHVTLWKRTNARGKERDRTFTVWRDRFDNEIRYSR